MAKKPIPTPEELRQLLRYDPETGRLFWLPRDVSWFRDGWNTAQSSCRTWNTKNAGREAFTTVSRGYHVGRVMDVLLRAHRVAWAVHYGYWPSMNIDHINGDRSDNRIFNLRDVDQSVNLKNTRRSSRNTSGVTGVSWNRECSKWQANIKSEQKITYLGLFDQLCDAKTARKQAEARMGFHQNHGRD